MGRRGAQHYPSIAVDSSMSTAAYREVCASEARFRSKVVARGGCWQWAGGHLSTGYGAMQLRVLGKTGAHRIAWALANGRWPSQMVLHRCGNRGCVNPDHLYEGGAAENADDARRHGTLRTGERHANAKLSNEQIAEVRRLYVDGAPTARIAAEFGISTVQVNNIARGRQRGGDRLDPLGRYRLSCEACGAEFLRKPGGRTVRFCSKACQSANQMRSVPQICLVCGTEFYRPPSAKAKTCSYRCMGVAQTKGAADSRSRLRENTWV